MDTARMQLSVFFCNGSWFFKAKLLKFMQIISDEDCWRKEYVKMALSSHLQKKKLLNSQAMYALQITSPGNTTGDKAWSP